MPSMPSDPSFLAYTFLDKAVNWVYFKPVLIIGGIFVLVFLFALVRKHIFQLSMRGAVFGFVTGIIMMLLLDLIIIFGMADKAKLGELTESESQKETFQEIFISGVSGLSNVLGVSTNATPKNKKPKTVEEVIGDYLNLSDGDAQKFRDLLCPQ